VGRGHIGATTLRVGPKVLVFQATPFPEIRPPSEVSETSVTFVQTAGGRPGVPLPRTVRRRPFVQLRGPTVWSTLALTIHADGSSNYELRGASTFPLHWIYDHQRRLVAKAATVDFDRWSEEAFGPHTPWGDEDSPVVTVTETALERQLSLRFMRTGEKPDIVAVREDEVVLYQGAPGRELYLLLDGVLAGEVDGRAVARSAPARSSASGRCSKAGPVPRPSER